jgi:hypothetical protein
LKIKKSPPEKYYHTKNGPKLNIDYKKFEKRAIIDTQEVLGQDHMTRATYRNKLSKPLYQRDNESFKVTQLREGLEVYIIDTPTRA